MVICVNKERKIERKSYKAVTRQNISYNRFGIYMYKYNKNVSLKSYEISMNSDSTCANTIEMITK